MMSSDLVSEMPAGLTLGQTSTHLPHRVQASSISSTRSPRAVSKGTSSDTLDAVPYVTMCNLANLNAALRGGVLDLIELRLLAVGVGPTLDYADAAEFLAGFEPLIEKVRRRRLQ